MKRCPQCGNEVTGQKTYCNSKCKWKAYYYRHPDRSETRRLRSQHANATFVDQFKTHCHRCGLTDKRVLDLHHITNDKIADVASLRQAGWSKKRLLEEIRKCIPLCANCHRILHWEERHHMKNNLTYSNYGNALTKGFEQCRLTAYPDVKGVMTIGWGHTGPDVYPGMTCSQAWADAVLLHDEQSAVDTVNNFVEVILTQHEFDALVDFVFNCGGEAFRTSTLLIKLNAGDYAGAAAQFDNWDHAAGKVVQGLLRRRQEETNEFNTGDVNG